MANARSGALWPVLLLACMAGATGSGCGGRAPEPSFAPPADTLAPGDGEFSVMTYNCGLYLLLDRTGDGRRDNPKPAEERAALIEIIREVNPDVLAVQEMGERSVFQEFQAALLEAGLLYEHSEYLVRGRSAKSMAVLSRYPIAIRESRLDDAYTISATRVPVLRGFIDIVIDVSPTYSFRLLVAHLKSKQFHPLGQTEMRRNEARLLGKHVRQANRRQPDQNILVLGSFNDHPDSAALQEVTGRHERLLYDVRPTDTWGDAWTRFDAEQDLYERNDYILVNAAMLPEVVKEKTRVIRHPRQKLASNHRPLVAVIRAKDDIPARPTPP